MWTSQEDARRYQGLTRALQGMASNPAWSQLDRAVAPEHLAVYLEWMELARDYATFLRQPLDRDGWQYWVPLALATSKPAETAALGILATDAYFQTAQALTGP